MPPRRTRPPCRTPVATVVALRCLACAWLALLMGMQMLASTLAGVHGIGHRHRAGMQALAASSTSLIRWRHDAARATSGDAHALMHARGDAHDHAATDASVLPLGLDAASDAVAQLAATLAPGHDAAWRGFALVRHVQSAACAWTPTRHAAAPPWRPPRA